MSVAAFVVGCKKAGIQILLLVGILLILHQDAVDDRSRCFLFGHAKEIEATNEWQRVEGNDTIPAGAHVRMDMTTGEKWVKLLIDDDDEAEDGSGKKSVSMAVVETDGTVKIDETEKEDKKLTQNNSKDNLNFEMMHRTLSKLPPEEIVAMGGLPELPDSKEGPVRTVFEKRMLTIWEKRQAELLEMELNFPEILKARIAGIKKYLADPETQLESIDLDADQDDDIVTDIVSLLKDLEFQLADIDMARDFHTMEGWSFLVEILAEETHAPINKTIDEFSRINQAKIRTIQSHAAWTIGTAVKNTEEFYPYAVESVVLKDKKVSTAIDLLIDVFCQKYDDPSSWEIRILLTKSMYAIGAILRGNAMAQTYVAKSDGFDRLGQKFKELSQEGFNSANTKLIQRLAGLSTDIVEDLSLNVELSKVEMDTEIVHTLSSSFCKATCQLFSSEKFIPVTVQETMVRAIGVLGPFCQGSSCAVNDFRAIVEKISADWVEKKESFDKDHFRELQDMARGALESLSGQVEKDL
uniref:Nucleotide exchange factor SIL1 n=1 Tax=Pseudo-nitzschia australis TaxID=44445 RepID=A0A6U9WBC5_9STRA|mmetsp:Transcript_2673/g.5779  ORF Transcript_2673/g.5779 Transcript_2673/m.5779 type:complete len:524 (+) Transcript_2673:163-1734(+)|eukprot:CAMPEP_0168222474 /NCGR_PEP_ID=MMETSP0140_2-20121125/10664_1 /TAXON_ID=44445 /ORGANISM="Pseudo-nitzschia australis, Strain 10249 10 AB" /LENGTH=523 /DNA_ID=CAMNT_0008152027 /DNA_START=87 /DNA_END=1658 /DNA_ORIENTATION=-